MTVHDRTRLTGRLLFLLPLANRKIYRRDAGKTQIKRIHRRDAEDAEKTQNKRIHCKGAKDAKKNFR